MARPADAPDPDAPILDIVAECLTDPHKWALAAWDWGEGELSGVTGPRQWQSDINAIIRDHLSNPATRFEPCLIAVASGHGIGKSALIGMLVNWAMSTCDDCRVVITANTDTQLRTKTSPEVGKWMRSSITGHWFDVQSTSITAREKSHAKTWRADFVPWSEHNTEAFAGLHNVRKRIVLVFDEGSAIADKVWEVAEGALTDEETEIIWVVFGNPTRNAGRFRECFRRLRHRWHHRQIDAREVPGTNKKQIAKWAEDYGEDSDFFKIRVRGQFPASSPKQFISGADVDAAFNKHLRPEQYNFAPVIIGVDPAWTGDDEFVIVKRQGLYSCILGTLQKNDNDIQMANVIARFEDEHRADAVFVDAGYGTGIVSAGNVLGRAWRLVWFGGKPINPGYLNKRSEIWGGIRDWLKQGGALPPDQILYQDLIGPELLPRLDGKIALESKEDMKDKGLPSPNRADALALTFAEPVAKKLHYPSGIDAPDRVETDYNPYR